MITDSIVRHNELSLAIAKACGVDAEEAVKVEYVHDAQNGGMPTLTLTYHVWNPDLSALVEVERQFVPKEH